MHHYLYPISQAENQGQVVWKAVGRTIASLPPTDLGGTERGVGRPPGCGLNQAALERDERFRLAFAG